MQQRNEILDEWKSINGNTDHAAEMPDFSVPDGYFNQLASQILAKIKPSAEIEAELKEIASLLTTISRRNILEVPDGYFEKNQLAENVWQKISEKEPVADLPASPENTPFTVPDGYFDSLANNILQKVSSPAPAKIIPLRSRFTRVWKYAAAAVIAILIGVSSLLYFRDHNAGNHQNVNAQLAQLSTSDIEQYLEDQIDVFNRDMIYNNVDTAATMSTLNSTTISDSDIQQYLNNQPDAQFSN